MLSCYHAHKIKNQVNLSDTYIIKNNIKVYFKKVKNDKIQNSHHL